MVHCAAYGRRLIRQWIREGHGRDCAIRDMYVIRASFIVRPVIPKIAPMDTPQVHNTILAISNPMSEGRVQMYVFKQVCWCEPSRVRLAGIMQRSKLLVTLKNIQYNYVFIYVVNLIKETNLKEHNHYLIKGPLHLIKRNYNVKKNHVSACMFQINFTQDIYKSCF